MRKVSVSSCVHETASTLCYVSPRFSETYHSSRKGEEKRNGNDKKKIPVVNLKKS